VPLGTENLHRVLPLLNGDRRQLTADGPGSCCRSMTGPRRRAPLCATSSAGLEADRPHPLHVPMWRFQICLPVVMLTRFDGGAVVEQIEVVLPQIVAGNSSSALPPNFQASLNGGCSERIAVKSRCAGRLVCREKGTVKLSTLCLAGVVVVVVGRRRRGGGRGTNTTFFAGLPDPRWRTPLRLLR